MSSGNVPKLDSRTIAEWEVPDYQVERICEKARRYCVCIFVLNEGEKIRSQLAAMVPWSSCVDIIIADGGSTDGSLDFNYLAEHSVTTLLTKTGIGRLSAQMRMALAFSLIEGYEGIITIDGNNKDNPDAIPRFVQTLDEGVDHVQGSRFIKGGEHRNTPLSRLLAVQLLHAPMISTSSGFRYTDTTNGFRAYSRKLLLDERVKPFRKVFLNYELHYYLAIRAARLGFHVVEVPVSRCYPDKGKVPTKISPVKGNMVILKTLFEACLGRYNP